MSSSTLPQDPFLGIHTSANGRKWVRREILPRHVEAMAQQGIDPSVAEVLSARGIAPDMATAFITPRLKDHLPDPSVLQDMDKAATRIAQAITEGEAIGIFGDYDVDGTSSAAMLTRYFRAFGTAVHVHLPDRMTEGYGPNIEAFRSLTEKGASLILTVDCGATAMTPLTNAQSENMEIIVLDHHLMQELPPAVAVVNPNRPDDTSELTMLSAGGVAFMTMVAVNRTLRQQGYFENRQEPNLLQWLDLVALSLVCDVMPLKGLTRILVRQGLVMLADFDVSQTGNPGIRGLADDAGLSGRAIASHFGFGIGPRINAAGRIGHAKLAFDLLTEDDPERVTELAQRLGDLNGARQGVEKQVLDAAMDAAEAKGGRDLAAPLIVADDGWHPGVIGIVAGRLKERFDRPTIVIAFDGGEGKGSGRSLPGLDLGEAISAAVSEGIIAGGGGHAMAAGLSLTRDQLPKFEAWLTDRMADDVAIARADQVMRLDGIVNPAGITASFASALEAAGPFGNGNPEPRFVLSDIRITHTKILKDKHIALTAQDGMGRNARCIAFGCVGAPLGDLLLAADRGGPVHLAGRVKPDDWRGGNSGQFQIEDAALPG